MKIKKSRKYLLAKWCDELQEIYISRKIQEGKVPSHSIAELELSKLCFNYLNTLAKIFNCSAETVSVEYKIMEQYNKPYIDCIIDYIEFELMED